MATTKNDQTIHNWSYAKLKGLCDEHGETSGNSYFSYLADQLADLPSVEASSGQE